MAVFPFTIVSWAQLLGHAALLAGRASLFAWATTYAIALPAKAIIAPLWFAGFWWIVTCELRQWRNRACRSACSSGSLTP